MIKLSYLLVLLQRQGRHGAHGGRRRQRLRGEERVGQRGRHGRRGRCRRRGRVLQDLLGRFGLAAVVVVQEERARRAAAGRPRPLHGRRLRGRRREVQGQLGLAAVEAAAAGGRRGRLAAAVGGRVGEALDLQGARGVYQRGEVLLQRGRGELFVIMVMTTKDVYVRLHIKSTYLYQLMSTRVCSGAKA